LVAYTSEDAGELISAARSAIELTIQSPKFNKNILEKSLTRFDKPEIVLIRLIHYPTKSARATSEINYEKTSAARAVLQASISAAFGVQNQIPISSNEVNEIIIELNVISDPMPLSTSYIRRRNNIEIGKHGIMIEYGTHRSIVLPSYAIDNKLNATKFLEAASLAAGLEKDHWKQPSVKVYRFEVQRFIEESPNGKVKIL
jgi:uncharacterized protein (TIGR00296 family)